MGKPCQLAYQILTEFSCQMSFYDAMDDFPAFHQGVSARSMEGVETRLVSMVDEIIVTSSSLKKKVSELGRDCLLVPNAFDHHCIKKRSPVKDPSLQRLVYIGSMGHWFDWQVLKDLASRLTKAEIDLFGTTLVSPPDSLPSNIHVHPPFRHDLISEVLVNFDAGLIPFKKCRLTDAVDPVKYYDYRASGLPIFTTTFGSMREKSESDGVFFIDNPEMMQIHGRPVFHQFHLTV